MHSSTHCIHTNYIVCVYLQYIVYTRIIYTDMLYCIYLEPICPHIWSVNPWETALIQLSLLPIHIYIYIHTLNLASPTTRFASAGQAWETACSKKLWDHGLGEWSHDVKCKCFLRFVREPSTPNASTFQEFEGWWNMIKCSPCFCWHPRKGFALRTLGVFIGACPWSTATGRYTFELCTSVYLDFRQNQGYIRWMVW